MKILKEIIKILFTISSLAILLIASIIFYNTYLEKKIENLRKKPAKEVEKKVWSLEPLKETGKKNMSQKRTNQEKFKETDKREHKANQISNTLSLEDVKNILMILKGKPHSKEQKSSRESQETSSKNDVKEKIVSYSILYGIDPNLSLAVAKVESDFNPQAISHKGCIGVFQIHPSLARRYGYKKEDLFDPDINIRLGIRILKHYLDYFRNLELALAAYHAGFNRVIRNGYKVPNIKETKSYIRKVKKEMEKTYV